MISRIIGIIFALALLLGGGYAVFYFFVASSAPKETPVHTVEVTTRDIMQVVRCVGEVEPALFTDLKAEVSGRIEKIHILEGDTVKKGDLLLELDRRELETQLQEAGFQIEAARLRSEKVKLDFESKRDLRQKGFVSEREFADAEIDFRLSENDLEIQRSQLKLLEEKLAKTKIAAPHDGVVLDHDLTEGMVITGVSSFNEGTILMRVAQLSALQVETEISEVDVDKVHRDMAVTLNFDSLPNVSLEGTVTFISPSAKPKGSSGSGGGGGNSAGSSKARVFPITVAFSAANVRVRPGMTAQVKVVVDQAKNVLAAELPGVFMEEGDNVVYVKNETGFDRRVVEVGISDHSVIEIKTGLKAGDLLATVRPAPAAEETPAAKTTGNPSGSSSRARAT